MTEKQKLIISLIILQYFYFCICMHYLWNPKGWYKYISFLFSIIIFLFLFYVTQQYNISDKKEKNELSALALKKTDEVKCGRLCIFRYLFIGDIYCNRDHA